MLSRQLELLSLARCVHGLALQDACLQHAHSLAHAAGGACLCVCNRSRAIEGLCPIFLHESRNTRVFLIRHSFFACIEI